MNQRRGQIAALAAVVYGCSMLFAFGAAGAVSHGIASFATDLVPSTSAHADPYGPYGPYGKTTICHNGVTITVSDTALPAHVEHGDTVGPCPPGTPHPNPPRPSR